MFETKDLRRKVKTRTLQKPKSAAPREFQMCLGEVRCRAEGLATRPIAKFHGDFRLDDRASRATIQQGLPVGGWLRFILPKVSVEQFLAAKKTVYFEDVNGKGYSEDMPNMNKQTRPGKTPGSGDSPFLFPGTPY
jgi:hypothetical protein